MKIVIIRIKNLFKKAKRDDLHAENSQTVQESSLSDDVHIGNGLDLKVPLTEKTALPNNVVQANLVEDKPDEEMYYNPVNDVVVEDCCPPWFYKKFPSCSGDVESPFWQVWSRHRYLGLKYDFILITIVVFN